MSRDGHNANDEYYVLIQIILGRRIVKPNRFGNAAAVSPGILTCQCKDFLQASRIGSIETIKNELANVSIFKATIDHMYITSRNFYDGSINIAQPTIIAAENSQKDNLHLGK